MADNSLKFPCFGRNNHRSDNYVTLNDCYTCGRRHSCDIYITMLNEQKDYEEDADDNEEG